MTAPRLITFNKRERARLADHCQALGIRFDEFVHDAAMQACDEMDGVQRSMIALPRDGETVIIHNTDEDSGPWRVLRATMAVLVKRREGEPARWFPMNMVERIR